MPVTGHLHYSRYVSEDDCAAQRACASQRSSRSGLVAEDRHHDWRCAVGGFMVGLWSHACEFGELFLPDEGGPGDAVSMGNKTAPSASQRSRMGDSSDGAGRVETRAGTACMGGSAGGV